MRIALAFVVLLVFTSAVRAQQFQQFQEHPHAEADGIVLWHGLVSGSAGFSNRLAIVVL